ncbi:TetR/AcrR family transcriptional regulator [Streptomyces sp. GESEQ-4]|uniref:TetR/AcrR family transcriptional regulator n=1 Tax=Streptomyces sp. GESEQ-4 TaxID=2812655 RepID=UPI001B322931|nr:TetR/AcrR family transcriptional regulator [Streptomyces sp. GESEQ-4]
MAREQARQQQAVKTRRGGRNAVRARVLEAVLELVAEHGLNGVRYDQIAERAGVHRASVYRNWPSVDELVYDAVAGYAEQMNPIADTGDIRADLVEVLLSLEATLNSPMGQVIMRAMHRPGPDFPRVQTFTDQVVTRRLVILRDRLDKATQLGQLPVVDARSLNELLSGAVHYRLASGRKEPFTRRDAEWIVDVVLGGVRSAERPD